VKGSEDIMSAKVGAAAACAAPRELQLTHAHPPSARAQAHGTTEKPVQQSLKWKCDIATADNICCFNRHYAEHSGYFVTTSYLSEIDRSVETTYYDSVTGKPLFIAPVSAPICSAFARTHNKTPPPLRAWHPCVHLAAPTQMR
jgi:hypothetical protein